MGTILRQIFGAGNAKSKDDFRDTANRQTVSLGTLRRPLKRGRTADIPKWKILLYAFIGILIAMPIVQGMLLTHQARPSLYKGGIGVDWAGYHRHRTMMTEGE